MNRRLLLVILIIVVLAVLGGIVFTQGNSQADTQITFLSQATVNSGDNVTFQLTDGHGNALANKNVDITYVKDGQNLNFTVVTDSEGKGYLALTGEEPGVRNVVVSFAGDEQYNPCNATQTITVVEASYEDSSYQDTSYQDSSASSTDSSADSSSDSSSSSSSSELNYDSDLNVYYDNDGIVRGGQNDGASYNDVKNNQPTVDSEGNLV